MAGVAGPGNPWVPADLLTDFGKVCARRGSEKRAARPRAKTFFMKSHGDGR
jgi:hypothetical protein